MIVPFLHPGRRPSSDEMLGRGLVDIQDPEAVMPTSCSNCDARPSMQNPLMLEPVDRNPRALARCYLYRAVCAHCKERAAR